MQLTAHRFRTESEAKGFASREASKLSKNDAGFFLYKTDDPVNCRFDNGSVVWIMSGTLTGSATAASVSQ
jgi:hypothetical protein